MSTRLRIETPAYHPAQQRIVDAARRFNVVACGRRFGKTTLAIDLLIEPALDGYPVAYFAPTYRMLSDVWRTTKRIVKPITRHVNEQEKRIELITDGVIDFWSLDSPDIARGRKYKRAIPDEAAMVRELEEAWNAVIRPTLTDYRGDAWFFSTPKGRDYFWSLFHRGQDDQFEDWVSHQMPSTANPFLDPQEIEAARAELPEMIFMQEYEALFIEDDAGVFRRVRDRAVATPQSEAIEGHKYVIGVDWGKLNDFTVISVIDTTIKEQCYLDRFNQIDYAVQLGRFMGIYERFKPTLTIPESNSMGVPLIEQLERKGIRMEPFETTNASKKVAIDDLALAFETGALAILNDPVQVNELIAYEMERLPSGMFRYNAPPGQHDDTVMALALAWQAAKTPPPASAVSEEPNIREIYGADRRRMVRMGMR